MNDRTIPPSSALRLVDVVFLEVPDLRRTPVTELEIGIKFPSAVRTVWIPGLGSGRSDDLVLGVCEEIRIEDAETAHDENRQSREEIDGGSGRGRLQHCWIDEEYANGDEGDEPFQRTSPPLEVQMAQPRSKRCK